MGFDYVESKRRIIDILSNNSESENVEIIPEVGANFIYDNGVKSWVSTISINIIDSDILLKKENNNRLARMFKAFFSEIIDILRQNNNYREIGIRDYTVYAIYSAPTQKELIRILSDAITINTFHIMFKRIMKNRSYPTFDIGIGIALSYDLVVKIGKRGYGINDYIWMGNSLDNSLKLSKLGNREGIKPIVLDKVFFNNIKEKKANGNELYSDLFKERISDKMKEVFYHGDMIIRDFNDWIELGMKYNY